MVASWLDVVHWSPCVSRSSLNMAAERARVQATDCSPIHVNGDMNVSVMNVYVSQRLPIEALNLFAEAERDVAATAASAAASSAVKARTAARAAASAANSVADNASAIHAAAQSATIAAVAVAENAARRTTSAADEVAVAECTSSRCTPAPPANGAVPRTPSASSMLPNLPPLANAMAFSMQSIAKKAWPKPVKAASLQMPFTPFTPSQPVVPPPKRLLGPWETTEKRAKKIRTRNGNQGESDDNDD